MIILFFTFLILSIISILGFGLIFRKFLFLQIDKDNLGLTGIFGLFALSIISSFTHLFFAHGMFHNLGILLIGIILFLNLNASRKNTSFLLLCFLLLLSSFILAKNNEDFPYYHLPNSLQFVHEKLQFGLGNLNHGFKHTSSFFLLNSLFYFPKIEYYLFNITNFSFLIFSIYFLIYKIFNKKILISNITKVLCILSIILLLSKFSRLAEYGTDISGQILIILSTIVASDLYIKKKFLLDKDSYLLILILIIFAVTIKVYFIIFLVFPLLIFLKFNYKKKILNLIMLPKNFIIIITPILFLILFNFSSTGCLVYPISFTCFPNFAEWGIELDAIKYLNTHYELWAKAGRTPNLSIENPEQYLSGLSWISNWYNNYFISKVSDFLLVVLTIIIIFSLFFYSQLFSNNKIKTTKLSTNFYSFYFLYVFLFLFWFFKFPQLRYGGYVILFFILTIPFAYYFSDRINFKLDRSKKNIIYLLSISFLIFNFKNINRINSEFNNVYLNKFEKFPLFYVNDTKYEEVILNGYKIYLVNGMCWATKPTCVRHTKFKIEERNNYLFYLKK